MAENAEPAPWLERLFEDERIRHLIFQLTIVLGLFSLLYTYSVHRKERFERQSKRQKNLINSFFNQAPDALFTFNKQGEIINENFKANELMSNTRIQSYEEGIDFNNVESRQRLWNKLVESHEDLTLDLNLSISGKTCYWNSFNSNRYRICRRTKSCTHYKFNINRS